MNLNPLIERLSDEDLIRCAHDLNTPLIEADSPIRPLVATMQATGIAQSTSTNFLFYAVSLAPALAWELAKRYKRELNHQQNPNAL